MKFQNLTHAIDIGSNSYLLEIGDVRIALDAGSHPKRDGRETLPKFGEFGHDTLDAIMVTHAHLDHMGSLPVLCRDQPHALVYMTEETQAVGEAMLHNSVNVMKSQRDELGFPEYPLFTHREIDSMARFWNQAKWRTPFYVGDRGEVRAEFYPAGHVPGAAGILLKDEASGETVFYTGDVHFEEQTMSKAADFPTEGIDTLIIETTRGANETDLKYTRERELARLIDAINATIARGGSALIPVFAFGKTQELLLMFHEQRQAGNLDPHIPIWIGGLSTKMTMLIDKFTKTSRRNHAGFKLLRQLPGLKSIPRRNRGALQFDPGMIYALSSGMMSENTVSNKFARNVLHDSRNGLFFVGYCDSESPAGRILAAEPGDKVALDNDSAPVQINCPVERFDFSGHACREALLDYILKVDPKHTILVHGDEPARQWFADQLKEQRPEMRVTIPQPGESFEC